MPILLSSNGIEKWKMLEGEAYPKRLPALAPESLESRKEFYIKI